MTSESLVLKCHRFQIDKKLKGYFKIQNRVCLQKKNCAGTFATVLPMSIPRTTNVSEKRRSCIPWLVLHIPINRANSAWVNFAGFNES